MSDDIKQWLRDALAELDDIKTKKPRIVSDTDSSIAERDAHIEALTDHLRDFWLDVERRTTRALELTKGCPPELNLNAVVKLLEDADRLGFDVIRRAPPAPPSTVQKPHQPA